MLAERALAGRGLRRAGIPDGRNGVRAQVLSTADQLQKASVGAIAAARTRRARVVPDRAVVHPYPSERCRPHRTHWVRPCLITRTTLLSESAIVLTVLFFVGRATIRRERPEPETGEALPRPRNKAWRVIRKLECCGGRAPTVTRPSGRAVGARRIEDPPPRIIHKLCAPISRAMYSAWRSASATIVSVGLAEPGVVRALPSETNRFGTSCARP